MIRKRVLKIVSLAAIPLLAIAVVVINPGTMPALADVPSSWKREWKKTDFSKKIIDLGEVRSGGPPKDGIPSIDKPVFTDVAGAKKGGLTDKSPVVSVVFNGVARAYPIQILMWHEIVNDTVGGVPVSVTFCPLCNSAIVFDRRLDGKLLDFGTTGKLRKSDMVMYDRQTETWWQQFLGQGLVGAMAGKILKQLPMRMESFGRFAARYPKGQVLKPNNASMRAYGRNPYVGYDRRTRPYFNVGTLPKNVPPLERVVVIGNQAWAFSYLKAKKTVTSGPYVISWKSGLASALDSSVIDDGRDVGYVIVQRKGAKGKMVDAVHDVSFAFAFHAFRPKGKIHALKN